MKKYPYKGAESMIFDCWHIGQQLLNEKENKIIGNGILDVWYKAHSWKEQLQLKDKTIRRQSLLIKDLRKENNRITIALKIAENPTL